MTCGEIFGRGQCEFNLKQHLRGASQNSMGLWETRLNCPECGCGKDDALDLNEIAEKENWN